jgi:hypothetical protein
MTTNDEQIMELREKIAEKKSTLGAAKRFAPITNCSLELDGARHNLHAIDKDQLIHLIARLGAYAAAAEQNGLLAEYRLAGFAVTDWIADAKARLVNLDVKAEAARLRVLEDRLESLLSLEKRTELAIGEIAASLK